MPIEILPAEEAIAQTRANKLRQYPSRVKGVGRITPFPRVGINSSFSFDADARIFASGSCFARNIEKALHFINFNVVSSPTDIPLPPSAGQPFQIYNKYTVHSILNELNWALAAKEPDQEALLVELADDKYVDLQIAAGVTGTKDEMLALRQAFNNSFRAANTADVIILTLGLVECWFDTETGVYLNAAPPMPALKRYPGRFEYHTLDYEDILNALEQIDGLLNKRRAEPVKMLITISPVPLVSTFRDQDVLIANTYSKSVQRAAVESFCKTHQADYFPSYETVTLSDMKYAWINKDFRHVRQETVDRIMAQVLKNYVGEGPDQSLLETRGCATAYFNAGRSQKTIELIEAYEASYGAAPPDLKMILALCYRRVRRMEDAVKAFETVLESDCDETLKEKAQKAAESARKSLAGAAVATDQRHQTKQDAFERLEDLRLTIGDDQDLDWLQEYILASQPTSREVMDAPARALNQEVRGLASLNKAEEFSRLFDKATDALKEWPNEPILYWHRALAARKCGRLEDAFSDFLFVARSDSAQSKAALRNAALTAQKLKRFDEAKELAEEYDRIYPQSG